MSSHVNGNCFYACLVYIITVTCYGLETCTYRVSEETAGNQNDWKGYQAVSSATECQEFCSSIPGCIAVEYSKSSRSCYVYAGPTTLLYNTDRVFMSRKCTTVTPDTKSDFITLHKTPPTAVPTTAAITTTTAIPVTTSPHTTTSPPTLPQHTRTNRAGYTTTPKAPRTPYTTAQLSPYQSYYRQRNFQNAAYGRIFPQYVPYRPLPRYPGYPHHYPQYPLYPRQQQILRTPTPEVKIITRAPSKIAKGRRGRLCFNKSKLPNIRFPDETPKFALVPSSDSGKVSLLVVPPKSSKVVCLWVTYRRNEPPILHLPTANPNKAYQHLENRLQEFVGAGTYTGRRNNVQSMFQDGNFAFNGQERHGNRDYLRSTVLVPILMDGGHGLFSKTSSPHTTRSSPVLPGTTALPKVHALPASVVDSPGGTNVTLKENTDASSNYMDKTLISGGILPMPTLKGKTKTKVNLTRETGSFTVGLSENASDVYLNEISRSTSESSTGSTQKSVRKIVRKLGSGDIVLPYRSSPNTTSSPITTRSMKNNVQSWPRDSPVKIPYPSNASENTPAHSTTPLSNMKGLQSRKVPHVEKTTVHPLKEHTTYISTVPTQTSRRKANDVATSPPVPVRRRRPRPNRKWRRNSAKRRWLRRRRKRLYGHVDDKKKGKHPGRYARRKYWRRARRLRSLRSVRHPSARRHQHRARTLRLRKSRRISSKSRH